MEDNNILKREEKLKRIKQEIGRLNKLFKDMDLKTRKAVHSLIENAAFMAISLEDLQAEINREGYTEKYQNGENQSGIKKSSKVEVYNAMVKNHMGVMKQLTDLLSKPEPGKSGGGKNDGDGFDGFVKKKEV
jgi:hypothetical protein